MKPRIFRAGPQGAPGEWPWLIFLPPVGLVRPQLRIVPTFALAVEQLDEWLLWRRAAAVPVTRDRRALHQFLVMVPSGAELN